MQRLARLGLALALFAPAAALAGDGLALTPPMGWNSWNKFGCDVSEKLIKGAADALVATGMKDAGYQYVVIDDCWQVSRDAAGKIVIDDEALPLRHEGARRLRPLEGPEVRDLLRRRDQDLRRPPGHEGLRGDRREDLRRVGRRLPQVRLVQQRGPGHARLLRADEPGAPRQPAGRSSSASASGAARSPGLWAQGIGHLWRATGDIQDCWDCGRGWGGMGVTHIIDIMADLYPYAGPGHWNDPDMLEVGNSGLTLAENRAHFSFWCLFAAPLMAGNDLETMKPEIKDDPDQRRGHRGEPGPAGDAGAQGLGRRAPRGVDEAARRRLEGGHPLQPRQRGGPADGPVGGRRPLPGRRAPGARPVGEEGPRRRSPAGSRRRSAPTTSRC